LKKNRIACLKCKAEGKDSGDDHAKPFDNGKGYYCYHGHGSVWYDDNQGERVSSTDYKPKENSGVLIAAINELPFRAYEPRSISKETMEWFGVRTGIDEGSGQPAEHYYPYTDNEGNVTGYKKRKLPKDFSSFGKIGGLFGKNKVHGTNFLIIVEGEADVLAARDMMAKLKPERAPYNVVSLPHGAREDGVLDATVRKEIEYLSQFNKIIICLDSDAPGQATANALADYLCSSVKEVAIASLPMKDTAAMWEAGKEKQWANAINGAKRYVSDQIVLGTDGGLEDLLVPLKRGIHFDFIPKTCRMLRGLRTREFTTLIAPPKCGKSSLLRYMQYQLLHDTDESVGGLFLEETTAKTKQSVLAFHAGMALNEFRANPQLADKHKVEEAYETLLPRLHLFQHKNKTITDDLLERKIEYLVKALGCKTVILDHSTFVTGTRETQNERRDIDMMLTRLARSVEDLDYRLFVVAHIKRGGKQQSRMDEKKKYPFWEVLSMDDARGSGAYEQLSHNMIALEKQWMDPEGESTRGLIRTRVLLSREWGVEGVGDYLTFDEKGRFKPVEVEV